MALKRNDDPTPSNTGAGSTSTPGKPYTPSNGNDDFETVERPKRQAIILLYGSGKTGKTSVGTAYAPDPVRVINFDGRADIAIHRAIQLGRDVKQCRIAMPAGKLSAEETQARARECVEKTVHNMDQAVRQSLERNGVRSILFDTATEYAEICKLAFDGVAEQTKQGAYGKDKDFVNRQFWRLFNLARLGNAHFIVTAREQEIWTKGDNGQQTATGEYKPRCPEVCRDAVDLVMNIQVHPQEDLRKKKLSKVDFQIKVTGCGANIGELGVTYTADDWGDSGPFAYACHRQFIDTSELSDWQ